MKLWICIAGTLLSVLPTHIFMKTLFNKNVHIFIISIVYETWTRSDISMGYGFGYFWISTGGPALVWWPSLTHDVSVTLLVLTRIGVFWHSLTATIFLPFKDLLMHPLVKEGVFAPGGRFCLHNVRYRVCLIVMAWRP